MVLCFFDRFYVTVGDLHVLEFDSPQVYMEHMRVSLYDAVLFPPVAESQETTPARSFAICEAWEENNCSTSSWRSTSVRKRAAR